MPRLRPAARDDLDAEARWYEAQETGLGRQFLAEVRLLLQRIRSNLEAYPAGYRGTRRALMRRLPLGEQIIQEPGEPDQPSAPALLTEPEQQAIAAGRELKPTSNVGVSEGHGRRGPVAIPSPAPPGCWLVLPRSPRLEASRSTPMGTAAAQRLTAILHREEEVYVAECPEVGTVSQGDTVEEALANLREATELFLEECPQPALAPRLLTTFEVSVA